MIILNILLILFCIHTTAYSLAQEIRQGVFYETLENPYSAATIHCLTIDQKLNKIALVKSAHTTQGEPISTILKPSTIAGINGGCFQADGTTNTCKINNTWHSIKNTTQKAFSWDQNSLTWMMDTITLQIKLEIDGQLFPVDSFNFQKIDKLGSLAPTIYTPAFGLETPKTLNTYYITVSNNQILNTHVANSFKEHKKIPLNGFVYSFSTDNEELRELADKLVGGESAKISIEVSSPKTDPKAWNSMDFIIGGTPLDDSLTKVSAHSALGITEDNLMKLIVVENNPGISQSDLAKLMRDLNCGASLCLSNDQSSTMVVGKNTFPSKYTSHSAFKPVEKRVPSALVVIPKGS